MIYELIPDKNIGINALRSIYTSHYLPKLNKNQINRVAFLMRTSFNLLSTNYLKKNEEEEETNIINKNDNKTTKTDNNNDIIYKFDIMYTDGTLRKMSLNEYQSATFWKIYSDIQNNK